MKVSLRLQTKYSVCNNQIMTRMQAFYLEKQNKTVTCYPGEIMTEMTLERGLEAGNYSNLGATALMDTCINKCCNIQTCDVAIKMNNLCFALTCRAKESCKIKSTLGKSSHHKLCFISRKRKERQSIRGKNVGLFYQLVDNTPR